MVRITQQQHPKQQAVQMVVAPPDPQDTDPADWSKAMDDLDDAIFHPLVQGEFVEKDDIDGLIDLYEELDAKDKAIYGCKLRIRQALVALTEGNAKTRRVRGKRRSAKVTMPDDSWDQSILREVWNSYPELADDVLAISQLKVKLREFKKLVNTSGDDAFNNFRDMVSGANRGPTGTATVSIEE